MQKIKRPPAKKTEDQPGTPLAKARAAYKKILTLDEDDLPAVDFILCTAVAIRMGRHLDQELLWSVLQGAPATGKTEMVRPIIPLTTTYILDTMTDKALLSGYIDDDGVDRSLLPQLDGKLVLIKDFSNMMADNPKVMHAVMGQLRPVFDQEPYQKGFGTGVRCHKSVFGILACCVPAADEFFQRGQLLGERFIKVRIARTKKSWKAQQARYRKRLDTRIDRKVWRAALRLVVQQEIGPLAKARDSKWRPPKMPRLLKDRLIAMSHFTCRARTLPRGDKLTDPEGPDRLLNQLPALGGIRLALDGRDHWTAGDLDFLARVACDTLPATGRRVLSCLWRAHPKKMKATDVASRVGLPVGQVINLLRQYRYCDLTDAACGEGWSLASDGLEMLAESGIFDQLPTHEKRKEKTP